ncbi:MAG: hypothetical protein ABEJ74_00735 [Haloferacaceae archaeon]
MTYPVTYYCPRCETLVELQREGYLADKSVTPYPLEGWNYVAPDDDFEGDDADGVRFVCGESDAPTVAWRDEGCGEPFYLSFVRFEDGREVEPTPESERIELGLGTGPSGPRGPQGPPGPGR